MKAFFRRLWARFFGPVCQDKNAIIYGNYGDAVVRYFPVVDSDGVVTEWIADPDSVARLAEADALRAGLATTPTPTQRPPQLPPQLPPQVPGGSARPPDFDPAAAGL